VHRLGIFIDQQQDFRVTDPAAANLTHEADFDLDQNPQVASQ